MPTHDRFPENMSTQNDDFISALSEVRVFLAIETVFGIPLIFVVPLAIYSIWAIFQAGFVSAAVFAACSMTALRIMHREDEQGLVIAVRNIGAPKLWLAGFGSRKTVTVVDRAGKPR